MGLDSDAGRDSVCASRLDQRTSVTNQERGDGMALMTSV
jgi:hypothetical protein